MLCVFVVGSFLWWISLTQYPLRPRDLADPVCQHETNRGGDDAREQELHQHRQAGLDEVNVDGGYDRLVDDVDGIDAGSHGDRQRPGFRDMVAEEPEQEGQGGDQHRGFPDREGEILPVKAAQKPGEDRIVLHRAAQYRKHEECRDPDQRDNPPRQRLLASELCEPAAAVGEDPNEKAEDVVGEMGKLKADKVLPNRDKDPHQEAHDRQRRDRGNQSPVRRVAVGVNVGASAGLTAVPEQAVAHVNEREEQQRLEEPQVPGVVIPDPVKRLVEPDDVHQPVVDIDDQRRVDQQRHAQADQAVEQEIRRAFLLQRAGGEEARQQEEGRHKIRLVDGGEPGQEHFGEGVGVGVVHQPGPAAAESDRGVVEDHQDGEEDAQVIQIIEA